MKADFHFHINNFYRSNQIDEAFKLYRDAGYDVIVCTDHFCEKDFKRGHSVNKWFRAWDAAQAAAQKYRITLVLGAEIRVDGLDHIVFPVTKAMLEEIVSRGLWSYRTMAALAHKCGAKCFQAHPLRHRRPEVKHINLAADGLEIDNRHPKHRKKWELPILCRLAFESNRLMIAGSDAHGLPHCAKGGICTEAAFDGIDSIWLMIDEYTREMGKTT